MALDEPTVLRRPYKRRVTPRRGMGMWLLLAAHALLFGAFIYFFPDLESDYPDLLIGNRAQLLIAGWTGLLLLQLVITGLRDVRQNTLRARDARIRRKLEQSWEAVAADGENLIVEAAPVEEDDDEPEWIL